MLMLFDLFFHEKMNFKNYDLWFAYLSECLIANNFGFE